MSYYYAGNLDSFNRLDQIEIQLDNGDTAILRKGHYYDLTAGELARARQYIVLNSSTVPADERPVGVYRLMVKGNPDDGDIPVWEDTEGAFIPQVVSGVSGGPYATTAALSAAQADLDVVERGIGINVLTHGAVGDGVADDTAEIQAAITAAGSGGRVYFPKGTYKITSALTVGLLYGIKFVGESWETTVITQATNNTPLFIFTADNTHSVGFEDVRLAYTTQQTAASHPNSYAIELRPGVSSTTGFYHWSFRRVKFSGATVGLGINNTNSAGFQISFWGAEFDTVLWERTGQHAVKLASPVSVGAPSLEFHNCKVFQSGVVPTGQCFYVRGEVHVVNLDVEDWYDRVWYADSGGNGSTFTGIHIEHHHVTEAGTRLIELVNANWSVRGLSVGFDTITTFGPHRVLSWSSTFYVDVEAVELATAATVTVSNETNLVYSAGALQPGRIGAVSIAKAGTGTLQAVRAADVAPMDLDKPLRRDWVDVEEFSGTDDQKLLAAASVCAANSKIMRWKRGKTYSTTVTLDWTTALNLGNLTMECEGAEILKAAAVYAMRADGTESAKVSFTADVPAKSFTVTLPTGQGAAGGWAMGHIIMLESALDVFGPDIGATVKYVRAREQHEVYKVVGDVLTLSGPTLWAHTTANGARYSKITPTIGRLIMRGGLQVRGNAPTDAGYLMRLTRLRDPLLEDITARDHSGGLQFFDCLGGRTKRYASYRNPSSTNPWYYSASMVGANVGVWIDGYTVRGGESEASFTTLADERAPVGGGGIDDTDPDSPNGDTFWGGSIDCGVTNGDVELGVNGTCYGSHSAALNFTYENCKARGGLLNFYMRSIGMKLISCSGRASSARAVGSTSSAEDAQIIGGEFHDATTEGIALSAVRQRVVGAHVHHCATGIALSGDDDDVLNCLIRENTNYGVQCSGGNNKRIAGNKIPKGTGGAQAVAVLNLGVTDVAHDNDCKGYGSTNPFITPTTGAIAKRNTFDAIFTINAASTLTIHQVRPTKLNAGTGTVDNITATGWADEEITFILNGAVTFKHFSGGTGNLRLHGAVDFVGTASDSITLICDGTNWFQKSPAAVV